MKLIYSLLLLFSFNTAASTVCEYKDLDSMPVQAGGRVKPLFVLASESFQFITGKSKISIDSEKYPTSKLFCKLSFGDSTLAKKIPLKIEHPKAKEFLSLKENTRFIWAHLALDEYDSLRSEVMTLKENNSYKKEITKILQRIDTYKAIIEARVWTFYIKSNGKANWTALSQLKSGAKYNLTKTHLTQAKSDYDQTGDDKYLVELKYKKWHLFSWSMLLSLLAIIILVVKKSTKPMYTLAIVSLSIQVFAMGLRVYISGRAPITNMYETVMFSGTGALLFGLIISKFQGEKLFTLMGLAYNILCLFMMTFANGMLSSSISPLVPVLRDNFWLSTHVTSIILSYAALALSWVLANYILILSIFKKLDKKELNYNVGLIYTCMKVGISLLSIGIILGGIWADYSWGRFWGWDPKETWSLIVLLIYMAILHGKYTNWIPPKRFVPCVAAAFMSVMMAWFGVNYILASGLHSYGFSEGGAIFLGSIFLVQAVILGIYQLAQKRTATQVTQD
jgi:cytochrome c-type biogenesis protein CcsB